VCVKPGDRGVDIGTRWVSSWKAGCSRALGFHATDPARLGSRSADIQQQRHTMKKMKAYHKMLLLLLMTLSFGYLYNRRNLTHSETLALRDTRTLRHLHSETLAPRDTRAAPPPGTPPDASHVCSSTIGKTQRFECCPKRTDWRSGYHCARSHTRRWFSSTIFPPREYTNMTELDIAELQMFAVWPLPRDCANMTDLNGAEL